MWWTWYLQCATPRNKGICKEVLWWMEKWKEACRYLILCRTWINTHNTCMHTDTFCTIFYLFRAMGPTSTIAQQFMKGSGVRTIGVAGEGCTMRVEISTRESGWRIRITDRASFDMVRELCFIYIFKSRVDYSWVWRDEWILNLCPSKWKLVWRHLARWQKEWKWEVLLFWQRPALWRLLGGWSSKMWDPLWFWERWSTSTDKVSNSTGTTFWLWIFLQPHILVMWHNKHIPGQSSLPIHYCGL